MPKKYRVEIARTAEKDLEDIWSHIAFDSIDNATHFIVELEEQIGRLEESPHRCPSIPENQLLGTEYRHLLLGDYRAIFRVDASRVYMLRIVHGNRLLDSSFFGQR